MTAVMQLFIVREMQLYKVKNIFSYFIRAMEKLDFNSDRAFYDA